MKFNIVNRDKSNAYATVRLTKAQFDAIRSFMHAKEDCVEFPRGITMVHQTRGHYRLWADTNDNFPTRALILAIKLASKALFEFIAYLKRIATNRPIAYVEGTFVNNRIVERTEPKPSTVAELAILLKRKFRVKPVRLAYGN